MVFFLLVVTTIIHFAYLFFHHKSLAYFNFQKKFLYFSKFPNEYYMITTGIKKLDYFLGGGIRGGIITDIFGSDGTGKSLLTMQISVNLMNSGNNVLFLDTTGGFRPERMVELIETRQFNPSILDKMKISRVTNTSEQIQILSKIQKSNEFSLVIVDNVTDLFSFEYSKKEQQLEKRILFMNYMHELSRIAIEKKIPIIVTNMIRKIDDQETENLEKPINIFTHLKIKLKKIDSKYMGQVLPSFTDKKEFSYLITKEGLVESS